MGRWIERGARKAKRYVMYTRGRMKKKGSCGVIVDDDWSSEVSVN
jgi:hypothetical protein